MRQQLTLFQSEYCFYKEIAQRLESKQGNSLEQIDSNLRSVLEREQDLHVKYNSLQQENLDLATANRRLMTDAQRTQRDLKQILRINEEFQQQAGVLKDREQQYFELGRDYREKLEIVKFERERIALKEEQFIRLLHKAETEQKSEVKRAQMRFEQKLTTRAKDSERRMDELEVKLSGAQSELEERIQHTLRLER